MRKLLACLLLAATLFSCQACSHSTNSTASATPGSQDPLAIKVWLNTASGVYHCTGTRWYGATKAGAYMTQKEAQDKGYRPAEGHRCQ